MKKYIIFISFLFCGCDGFGCYELKPEEIHAKIEECKKYDFDFSYTQCMSGAITKINCIPKKEN